MIGLSVGDMVYEGIFLSLFLFLYKNFLLFLMFVILMEYEG